MELAWWEAVGLFVLWIVQFLLSLGPTGELVHWVITWIYFAWSLLEFVRLLTGQRKAMAMRHFREILNNPSGSPR
jgi:hypothetical protein